MESNQMPAARRGGVEVAGWTLDRKIRVRFPAYPHRVWALWWQGGKRHLRTSRCPCRGRLSRLKTPSCPWHWVPSSRSKFGNRTFVPSLYSWNIAECDVKPQSTTTTIDACRLPTSVAALIAIANLLFVDTKKNVCVLFIWLCTVFLCLGIVIVFITQQICSCRGRLYFQ